jgi:hypothetical protein
VWSLRIDGEGGGAAYLVQGRDVIRQGERLVERAAQRVERRLVQPRVRVFGRDLEPGGDQFRACVRRDMSRGWGVNVEWWGGGERSGGSDEGRCGRM